MKQKWIWVPAALLLIGLLAGATLLYDNLRQSEPAPEQLAQETTGGDVVAAGPVTCPSRKSPSRPPSQWQSATASPARSWH